MSDSTMCCFHHKHVECTSEELTYTHKHVYAHTQLFLHNTDNLNLQTDTSLYL